MAGYTEILVEARLPATLITLNRPQALNAITPTMLDELAHAIAAAGQDPAVSAVIITGAGEKAWSAGVDIKGIAGGARESIADRRANVAWDVLKAIDACPAPVIAAINGFCITGGLELATACDMLLASDRARFADTHARWGLTATWGGTQRLPRIVGKHKAMEMMFLCDMVDAQEALRIGLVNKVVPHEKLLDEAMAWARKLAENSRHSISSQKALVVKGLALPLAEAHAMARRESPGQAPDAKQRMESFVKGTWDKSKALGKQQ
jgi:enoyl-CoA hydratase/carnithine racemase